MLLFFDLGTVNVDLFQLIHSTVEKENHKICKYSTQVVQCCVRVSYGRRQ